MIRIALFAWISGIGLTLGATAVLSGPGTAAPAAKNGSPAPRPVRAASAPVSAQVSLPAPRPEWLALSQVAEPQRQPSDPAIAAAGELPNSQLPSHLPPALPVAAPVSVQFDGVSPSQIVGDRVNLNLATTGNVKSYVWTVMPPGTVGMKVYEGGSKADFTSRFSGTYVFLVAVAGTDGSVAQAYHTLELRGDYVPVAPPQAAVLPKAKASDPTELVRQWTAEVNSLHRRAEQLQVASAFRQAAGAIDSGMFADGDLFAQTKTLAALSLGGALGSWAPWFDKVEQLYREFQRLKVLGTPANFSAANKSVARALETTE